MLPNIEIMDSNKEVKRTAEKKEVKKECMKEEIKRWSRGYFHLAAYFDHFKIEIKKKR